MTLEQRKHILRGLRKNSPVKYIGKILIEGRHTLQKGAIVHKVRNGRTTSKGDRIGYMIVKHTDPRINWYLPYSDLTCKAIEVIERLEQSTQKPTKP